MHSRLATVKYTFSPRLVGWELCRCLTSVTPLRAGDLKGLGTFVKWTTSDPTVLATLHEAVVRLVQEIGISGMVEIANSVKMTAQVAHSLGETGAISSSRQLTTALLSRCRMRFSNT